MKPKHKGEKTQAYKVMTELGLDRFDLAKMVGVHPNLVFKWVTPNPQNTSHSTAAILELLLRVHRDIRCRPLYRQWAEDKGVDLGAYYQ